MIFKINISATFAVTTYDPEKMIQEQKKTFYKYPFALGDLLATSKNLEIDIREVPFNYKETMETRNKRKDKKVFNPFVEMINKKRKIKRRKIVPFFKNRFSDIKL